MFCTSCGNQMPDGAQFCTFCGAYLTPPAPAAAAGSLAAQPVGMPPLATTQSGRRFAGFWVRFLAVLIDGIILQAVGLVLFLPIGFLLGLASMGNARIIEQLAGGTTLLLLPLSFVMNWLYEATFMSSARQATPGKMALNLVVTDQGENRISFGRATGRHFGKYLSSFTLLIGYLIQPFTERRQALHDLLAGTLVVRR